MGTPMAQLIIINGLMNITLVIGFYNSIYISLFVGSQRTVYGSKLCNLPQSGMVHYSKSPPTCVVSSDLFKVVAP